MFTNIFSRIKALLSRFTENKSKDTTQNKEQVKKAVESLKNAKQTPIKFEKIESPIKNTVFPEVKRKYNKQPKKTLDEIKSVLSTTKKSKIVKK